MVNNTTNYNQYIEYLANVGNTLIKDDFLGDQLSDSWTFSQGSGQSQSVDNSQITLDFGTVSGSESSLKSNTTFNFPVKARFVFNISKLETNQSFSLGVVSEDNQDYAIATFRTKDFLIYMDLEVITSGVNNKLINLLVPNLDFAPILEINCFERVTSFCLVNDNKSIVYNFYSNIPSFSKNYKLYAKIINNSLSVADTKLFRDFQEIKSPKDLIDNMFFKMIIITRGRESACCLQTLSLKK